MCGLVGFATTLTALTDTKFLKHALVADTIRGPHSTGVVACDATAHVTIKEAVTGPEFVYTNPEFDKLCDAVAKATRPTAMIGHNRWATIGEINDDTAHPFTHGSISGVHNGTLMYHDDLADGLGKGFDVDSEAIIFALDRTTDFGSVLEELDGAFALVWHDINTNTIHFARNDERTLFIAESDDGKTICWASEFGMLRWLIDRNYLNKFTITKLPVGDLVSYCLDADNLVDDKEIKKFTPLPAFSQRYYSKNYQPKYQKPMTYNSPVYDNRRKLIPNPMYLDEVYGKFEASSQLKDMQDLGIASGQVFQLVPTMFLYYNKAPQSTYGRALFETTIGDMTYTLAVSMDDTIYVEGATYEVLVENSGTVYANYDYVVFSCRNLGVVSTKSTDIVPFEPDTVVKLSNCDITKRAWDRAVLDGCDVCGEAIEAHTNERCSFDSGLMSCKYCVDTYSYTGAMGLYA